MTIVPAMTAGIAQRVGSPAPEGRRHPVVNGDPIDPRTTVLRVFIEGESVYDSAKEARRW